MALLPARNILDGSSIPTTGTMKTAMGSLRDYLAGLLGTDSTNPAAARSALGAAASGGNSDITSLSGITSINGGQLAGMRNRIINGDFRVNQRLVSGTVTLTAGVYGHDRWKAGSGGCTYTFSTTNNVTTLNITSGTLMQVIEGVNLASGSSVLSWSGSALGRVDSGAYGASGTVGTTVGGTNQTVEFSTGTLSKVQYEVGTTVTVFEQRAIGLELLLCQRYYEVLSGVYSGYAAGTTAARISIPYKATKRTVPSLDKQLTGIGYVNNINGNPFVTSYTLLAYSTNSSAALDFNVAGGLTIGQGVIANAADLLTVSCEL